MERRGGETHQKKNWIHAIERERVFRHADENEIFLIQKCILIASLRSFSSHHKRRPAKHQNQITNSIQLWCTENVLCGGEQKLTSSMTMRSFGRAN